MLKSSDENSNYNLKNQVDAEYFSITVKKEVELFLIYLLLIVQELEIIG